MILPQGNDFIWDENAWKSHIESVVMAIGMYETDHHCVRRPATEGVPWTVEHRRKDGGWDCEFYDDLATAIGDFVALEQLPDLGGAVRSNEKRDISAQDKKEKVMAESVRQVYHVVPAQGGWEVKKQGNKRPSAKAARKVDAVQKGKELAKKAALGQIIIHKKDGTIQTEHTYGADPRRSRG